ncbi:hypothetical protein BDV23DRAFT_189605 [Aspergillus alliaceus]|uniref:Major facilitator superfamily domain-containing protein n=1 Tax=Petromyces alliaceus TaxID=209559 RepID=A0A5N7BR22_PETAA|nr:hypothetical protein BDV23DRAFT_189605 [Aspergillus alliaceus]
MPPTNETNIGMKDKLSGEDYAFTDLREDRKLLRKVDWRILPIMFLKYFLQFLDKISLNYANVMGLQNDLNMCGNDFSWLATAFFLAYAIAEIPQGVCRIHKLFNTAIGAEKRRHPSLEIPHRQGSGTQCLPLRRGSVLFGGCTEFCRVDSFTRFTWNAGGCHWLGVGQIVGGLISSAAQHTFPDISFHGWRIMFVVVGVVNIVAAILVLLLLPENVEKAEFLSQGDRDRIAQRLLED